MSYRPERPGTSMLWNGLTPPVGWLLENGSTIGSATSGGTSLAHAKTQSLFTFLWTNYANTELAIQDSTGAASVRGASAAADFTANKRIPLPDARGRSPMGAGLGATLTNRVLGQTPGVETVTLTSAQSGVPAHGHTASQPSHSHAVTGYGEGFSLNGGGAGANFRFAYTNDGDGANLNTVPQTPAITVVNAVAANAAASHSIIQPSIVKTLVIKT